MEPSQYNDRIPHYPDRASGAEVDLELNVPAMGSGKCHCFCFMTGDHDDQEEGVVRRQLRRISRSVSNIFNRENREDEVK